MNEALYQPTTHPPTLKPAARRGARSRCVCDSHLFVCAPRRFVVYSNLPSWNSYVGNGGLMVSYIFFHFTYEIYIFERKISMNRY